jgi:hypothetical protein
MHLAIMLGSAQLVDMAAKLLDLDEKSASGK